MMMKMIMSSDDKIEIIIIKMMMILRGYLVGFDLRGRMTKMMIGVDLIIRMDGCNFNVFAGCGPFVTPLQKRKM